MKNIKWLVQDENGQLNKINAFIILTENLPQNKGEAIVYLFSEQNHVRAQFLDFFHRNRIASSCALFQTSKNGYVNVVALLLNNGADYVVNPKGFTPLSAAVKYGHLNVVKYLLSEQNPQRTKVISYINQMSKTGATSLYNAAAYGYVEIVALLFNNGAIYIENLRGSTPLFAATYNSQVAVVKYLLSTSNPKREQVIASINKSSNHTGTTALFEASINGDDEIVALLLENGASYTVDEQGITPLWLAAQEGHLATVKYLLSARNPKRAQVMSYLNMRYDKTGASALFEATDGSCHEIVSALLDVGASFITNDLLLTPLDVAEFRITSEFDNYADLVKLFRESKNFETRIADIGYQDSVPNIFVCPISRCIMSNPLVLSSGHVFDQDIIMEWLGEKEYCIHPYTKEHVSRDEILQSKINGPLKVAIIEYITELERRTSMCDVVDDKQKEEISRTVARPILRKLFQDPLSSTLMKNPISLHGNNYDRQYLLDRIGTAASIMDHQTGVLLLRQEIIACSINIGLRCAIEEFQEQEKKRVVPELGNSIYTDPRKKSKLQPEDEHLQDNNGSPKR